MISYNKGNRKLSIPKILSRANVKLFYLLFILVISIEMNFFYFPFHENT